ncbi:MAG: glycosyltransferase family 4 protein [Ignavibacteria bacterium]|nr:glycosyltransferase family 4 protein [Ignavibacteria bacterium]
MKNAKEKLKKDSGIQVYFVPQLPVNRFLILSYLNIYYCFFCVFFLTVLNNFNIIHCHGLNAVRPSIIIKKFLKKIKIVFNVHGATPEERIYSNPSTPKKWLTKLEKDETFSLKYSDGVIFVSDALKNHYINKYNIFIDHSVIIPCLFENIINLNYESISQNRKKLNLKSKIVFIYVGSYRKYQLPYETLKFFSDLNSVFDNAFLIILTSHIIQFSEILDELKISKDRYFVKQVKHSEISEYISLADFGFLLRENNIVNNVASPTKFGEYLSCGVPLIMSDHIGDYSEFTYSNNLGIVLNNNVFDNKLINEIKLIVEKRMDYFKRSVEFAKLNLTWNENFQEQLKEFCLGLFNEKKDN